MPSECPTCHKHAVEAEEGEELVCRNCGVVVEGGVFNFERDINGSTFISEDGTAKFDGRFELPRAVRQRLPSGGSTATQRVLQSSLHSLVKRMNLSNDIHKKARVLLFREVLPLRSSRQVQGLIPRRSVLVSSCLFIVCRQNDIHVTYRHMAEVAECNMFLIGKCVKIISKALHINLAPLNVESLVLRILSELSVSDNSCERLSLDLWQLLKRFGLSQARNKALKALSLVLLVLECKKISPTKGKILEVLRKNSLKKQDLQMDTPRLKDNLLDLAKEVPWVPDTVKRKDITKHIITVVDFYKKCGKLDASIMKPRYPSMKKKEIADNDRKLKIQMAKRRILDKQQGKSGSNPSDAAAANSSTIPVSSNLNNSKEGDKGSGDMHALQPSQSQEMFPSPLTDEVSSPTVNRSSKCVNNASETANSGSFAVSSEGDLDHNDMLIEELLKYGYSEEELMDGYFESRMCDVESSSQLDPHGEREDLDEMDIAEREMHHYLWSVAEMERLKNLKYSEEHEEI